MAALPKDLQLDLLAEFQFLPGDLEAVEDEKFGKVSRDGRSLLRYRARDYRIYFEKHPDEEDGEVAKTNDFWSLIHEAEEARK